MLNPHKINLHGDFNNVLWLLVKILYNILDEITSERGVGENRTNERVSSPYHVFDNLTTAQVFNLESKLTIAIISFK